MLNFLIMYSIKFNKTIPSTTIIILLYLFSYSSSLVSGKCDLIGRSASDHLNGILPSLSAGPGPYVEPPPGIRILHIDTRPLLLPKGMSPTGHKVGINTDSYLTV